MEQQGANCWRSIPSPAIGKTQMAKKKKKKKKNTFSSSLFWRYLARRVSTYSSSFLLSPSKLTALEGAVVYGTG